MRERLIELIGKAELSMWGQTAHGEKERRGLLADYLLAEGVILPPCKVGDTVWFTSELYEQPFQTVITSIEVYEEEIVVCASSGTEWHCEDFGKTVFLTKESAEQALQKERVRNERN